MKKLCIVIFLFVSIGVFAQKSADELARKVFSACIKNDERTFKVYYPKAEVLNYYFKIADPKRQFPKDIVKQKYPRGLEGALYGFELFQKAIVLFGLDLKDIKLLETEAVENDIEIMKSGKKVGAVYNKIVTLYFMSGGKKYAFVVPNAIEVKGRWFISDQIVSLHEIEETN